MYADDDPIVAPGADGFVVARALAHGIRKSAPLRSGQPVGYPVSGTEAHLVLRLPAEGRVGEAGVVLGHMELDEPSDLRHRVELVESDKPAVEQYV